MTVTTFGDFEAFARRLAHEVRKHGQMTMRVVKDVGRLQVGFQSPSGQFYVSIKVIRAYVQARSKPTDESNVDTDHELLKQVFARRMATAWEGDVS